MPRDLKLAHAKEFTDVEDAVLDIWLEAENEGFEDDAAEILDTGLLVEHYLSTLDHDPAKRLPGEIKTLAGLQTAFHTAVTNFRFKQANARLGTAVSGD